MSACCESPLFPLRLAPFEQYMFTDDRPGYPACFHVRLEFSGRFQRGAFQTALDAALMRHPLLRCVVRPLGERHFQWVPLKCPSPNVRWLNETEPPPGAPHPRIDLWDEIGLRITMREQGEVTRMLLQFHHACCDGLGAMGFVEDLLGSYHNAVAQERETVALRPLDPSRLRVRSKFGLSPLKYLLRIHKEITALFGVVLYFVHRPLTLASPAGTPPPPVEHAEYPATCVHTFSRDQSLKVRQAAKQLGCTINDLLLRDLFLTLSQWTSEHDPNNGKGVLRVMVPTNLRLPEDAVMPAANVVSMCLLDRRVQRSSSARRLLKSVRLEIGVCKRWRLGLTMIHAIRLVRSFRGALARMLAGDRCLATTVLSNFGEPMREMPLPRRDGRIAPGDVILEALEVFPPVRPMTWVSFGIVSYVGRMCICLEYVPQRLTPLQARELLDSFVERIAASAGVPAS